MNEVTKFRERLKKIGYELELEGNAPWIYLKAVNENPIKQKDWTNANHGYCVAWFPKSHDDNFTLNWQDIKTTFMLLRKYGRPIWKFNGGAGATLCHNCRVVISKGFTQDLKCQECKFAQQKP